MKKVFLFLVVFGVVVSLSFLRESPAARGPGSFAVVELFTSQGCSSCPPADALLSKVIADAAQTGKQVFPLSFHVDYWNRLGWKDPFSQPAFSERQKKYANKLNLNGVYTPQMVVNGAKEFVGSNERELQYALRQSEKERPQLTFKKAAVELKGATVTVNYALTGSFEGCKLNVALVSNSAVTTIRRGENEGRTLRNDHVVRYFLSLDAKSEGRVSFPGPNEISSNKDNYTVILFVQHEQTWKILGATAARFI